jgi:hypothetical protein
MVQSIANSFCAAIHPGKAARVFLRAKTSLPESAEGEINNISAKKRSERIIGAPKIFRQTAPARLLHGFHSFSSRHIPTGNNPRDLISSDFNSPTTSKILRTKYSH